MDIHVDQDTETFELNFVEKGSNGKVDIFLSKNSEVLINVLHINIDTSSQDVSYIINSSLENMINILGNPLDIYLSSFLTAELNFNPLIQGIQGLENELDQTGNNKARSNIIHNKSAHELQKNRYGLHSIERIETHALELEKIPDLVVSYNYVFNDKHLFYIHTRRRIQFLLNMKGQQQTQIR